MTNREFFVTISNTESVSDELREYAREAVAKLDHTNELRREAAAKKSAAKEAEKAPIRDAILAVMSNEPMTASDLIAAAGVEIKPQAIPSLLKGLVADGVIVKSDVKVTGKGTQKGYALA